MRAGDTALRALVDGLLRGLQAAAPAPAPASAPARRGVAAAVALATAPDPDWQLRAAAAVVATTEVLFGASPAWQPQGQGLAAAAAAQRGAGPGGAPAAELEALAGAALAEYLREDVWGVPTSLEAAAGRGGRGAAPPPTLQARSRPPRCSLPRARPAGPPAPAHTARVRAGSGPEIRVRVPQEVGQNALLARVLLEAVGAAARASGPRFASSGRLLRPALLPLLERLADPCASVAAPARAALGSVCAHCGCAMTDERVC